MKKIAIIGGGIAGAQTAVELAARDHQVIIIEKSDELGGNIKDYGCKAVDVCLKDNLCLVDDVFNEVEDFDNIDILFQTRVNDFTGKPGSYSLGIEREGVFSSIDDLDYLVVATGYTKWSDLETGTPEVYEDKRIIWASQLEEFIKSRKDHLDVDHKLTLDFEPESAVFIQCNGSRSIQEKAKYCSRICCGYSYRMARVLKHFFPEIEITIFFMDLQEGGYLQELSYQKLDDNEIGYINCKPIKVSSQDEKINIFYEDQKKGKKDNLKTDLLILSEGIHAKKVNEEWSRLFNLQLDEYGFLYPIEDQKDTNIYLAGTIKGPKDIAGTISDSKNVAYKIINDNKTGG
ncbi:MAG: FAD-dependent oxidoreductase [Halanaerobiales bacterium]|nr:FAD-dependent oxidoreductase [Halanaerobiales bacterium]